MKKNLFYAQSGGVTAVINASAEAVITAARDKKIGKNIGKVFCGYYGILGALEENLVDMTAVPASTVRRISNNPGGVFGSCRFKLSSIKENKKSFDRLLSVFDAHNIGYFLYNGGGDSADTTYKIWQAAKDSGYPLSVAHIPKTIDNDLQGTDCSPGFASVAKYVALSCQETSLDLAAMHRSSTKVFVFEVMGRHAGWIAASAGLAQTDTLSVPLIILFPEIPFSVEAFTEQVKRKVAAHGYVTVVVSEGIRSKQGTLFDTHQSKDAFGHRQLGGVGASIASIIESKLQYKCHTAIADYLQRSARHVASKVDLTHASALGTDAVRFVASGKSGRMLVVKRISSKPYRWRIDSVALGKVANKEKLMPRSFITKDGFGITARCKNYMLPLIQGEAPFRFKQGVGDFHSFNFPQVKKKLAMREGKTGHRIIFIGPPGAGKGTQAEILCSNLGIVKVSCGDLLRTESRSGSPLGKKLSSYMNSGTLVPDSLITEIMIAELQKKEYQAGYLLDGYPRTVNQAKAIITSQLEIDAVIELAVDQKILINRITGRWIHEPSGRIYHTSFNPPKKPFTDDITGEPLMQRKDDKPETVSHRLLVYEQETKPLTAFYQTYSKKHKQLLCKKISGIGSIKSVQKRILNALKR